MANAKKSSKGKHVASHKSHVASEPVSGGTQTWVIVTLIVSVLVVVLGVGWTLSYLNSKASVVPTISGLNLVSGVVNLVIVEDPTCVECRSDEFAMMFKSQIIPDLEYQKVNYTAEFGKEVLRVTGSKFVPIYLFSTEITKSANWTQLSPYFLSVNVSGVEFYMLSPEVVQAKVFIEDVPVLEGSVVMGDPNAEVTVYEFTDYECPFCAIAEGNAELVEQFKARYPDYVAPIPSVYKNYVANDKIRYVFYNYPIPQLHPLSMSAHLAVMCANEQGKWKEFNTMLFDRRGNWSEMTASERVSTYKGYAKEISLDSAKFDSCLDSKKYESQIEKEIELGKSLGVSGTPGFFVNRVFISGAQDYATFEGIIESELSK